MYLPQIHDERETLCHYLAAQLEALLEDWLDRTPQLAALVQPIDLSALGQRAVITYSHCCFSPMPIMAAE